MHRICCTLIQPSTVKFWGERNKTPFNCNSMITRSKLVEQLRDYQVRSQHKCPPLAVFSPKPLLSTWGDVALAAFWALIFFVLLISSYVTLYLQHYWISSFILCIGILLPIRLRILRQSLARKRDRRMLLPLSMWISSTMVKHLTMFSCSEVGFSVAS